MRRSSLVKAVSFDAPSEVLLDAEKGVSGVDSSSPSFSPFDTNGLAAARASLKWVSCVLAAEPRRFPREELEFVRSFLLLLDPPATVQPSSSSTAVDVALGYVSPLKCASVAPSPTSTESSSLFSRFRFDISADM